VWAFTHERKRWLLAEQKALVDLKRMAKYEKLGARAERRMDFVVTVHDCLRKRLR